MKGFSTPKIEGKFSLRSSSTGMILMDEVEVPKDNLLPNVSGLSVSSCSNSSVNKNTIFCILISDIWSGSFWLSEQCALWDLMGSAGSCRILLPRCPSVHHGQVRQSVHILTAVSVTETDKDHFYNITVSSIRIQFGVPLARNQLMQKKMADMLTEITIGLQSCLTLGRLIEQKR